MVFLYPYDTFYLSKNQHGSVLGSFYRRSITVFADHHWLKTVPQTSWVSSLLSLGYTVYIQPPRGHELITSSFNTSQIAKSTFRLSPFIYLKKLFIKPEFPSVESSSSQSLTTSCKRSSAALSAPIGGDQVAGTSFPNQTKTKKSFRILALAARTKILNSAQSDFKWKSPMKTRRLGRQRSWLLGFQFILVSQGFLRYLNVSNRLVK